MNKTQLEAVERTLNSRAQSHIRAKSDLLDAKIKPSAATEDLAKEYQKVLDKVQAHNDRAHVSLKIDFKIETGYRNEKVSINKTGYTSVSTPGSYGGTTVVPEMKKEGQAMLEAVQNYVLALTLGQETIDGMEAFMSKLLK